MHAPLLCLLVGVAIQAVDAERASGNTYIATDSKARFHLSKSSASRSSATLAVDSHSATESAESASTKSASSSMSQLRQTLTNSARMIPGEGGRAMLKMMAGCVCFVVLFKMLSRIDCYSKRLDCRRCRLCARFLYWIGYDEFHTTRITVTVHSVADVVNRGILGGEKLFKVVVAFRWSKFATSSTTDMKWEQTKGMDIPQGADECVISLYSEGKIKDSLLGEYVMETKKDMLDAKKFWGEKKKLKLEHKNKVVGTVIVTFRHQDDEGEEGGSSKLPIDGVPEESALAIAIKDAYEDMIREGVIKKPEPQPALPQPADGEAPPPPEEEIIKLEGNQKIECLGRCVTGPLREVTKDGKESGKTFIRVVNCNFAELQGADMKKEMAHQWKKAQDKGLKELPKKWYWVWYEDKRSAFDDKKWHEPDGYIPLTAISKINRQPERNDQFVVTYQEDGEKKALIYRREGGKSLDVWIDGLDLCFNACRTMVKAEKESEERRKKGLPPL